LRSEYIAVIKRHYLEKHYDGSRVSTLEGKFSIARNNSIVRNKKKKGTGRLFFYPGLVNFPRTCYYDDNNAKQV